MRVFAGYDRQHARGFHAFLQSVVETSPGTAIDTISAEQFDGSNAFTYARYAIPERMGWAGQAIFVDGSDMLLREDLAGLAALADPAFAVQVVKHEYGTRHARKYVGTPMECDNGDYPRKNWSSVVIWNCAHLAHKRAAERLRTPSGTLHRFPWLEDSEIGRLPIEWNWLADEYGKNARAKLLHWTAGIPGFAHYQNVPHADEWHAAADRAWRAG